MTNADSQLHVFSTFMGIPPDTGTPPVCGVILSSAYDGRNAPRCVECERILGSSADRRIRQETEDTAIDAMLERRRTPVPLAAFSETTPEHPFVAVRGQTGCARCGYARGHHPKRVRVKLTCNECGKRWNVSPSSDPQCPKCNSVDYEVIG